MMSAPAALAFSKLFYPETEVSQTKAKDIKLPKGYVFSLWLHVFLDYSFGDTHPGASYQMSHTRAVMINFLQKHFRTESNVLDAAAQGAVNSVFLVLNITANMVAFLAFIAFLNGALSWFGNLLGAPYLTFDVIKRRFSISNSTTAIAYLTCSLFNFSTSWEKFSYLSLGSWECRRANVRW